MLVRARRSSRSAARRGLLHVQRGVRLAVPLHEAGWKVVFFAGAEVVHVGGEATKRDWGRMFTAQVRSHVRFVRKHQGAGAAAVTRAAAGRLARAAGARVPRRARTKLPAGGPGPAPPVIELYLRLAGATLLLLAPGALLARSASGALVASLGLLFAAMVVVFATGSSSRSRSG
jgi:hypothetical protein